MLRTTLRLQSGFANGMMMAQRVSAPIESRVVSTPSWPVPYYQRLSKAYPVYQPDMIDLHGRVADPNDLVWIATKKCLNFSTAGRILVEDVEQNAQISDYLIYNKDCELLAKCFLDDMVKYVDISNKEAVRILKDKTLI